MNGRPWTASICFLLAASGAWARPQEPVENIEGEIVEIAIEREVVVTASKHEQSLWDAPATMYVLTEEDIQASGAKNLSDLLRQIPGMEAKTWLSEFQNLSLRGLLGASVVNERILWLLDGVPWNDVRDGGVWGGEELPLELIKRIEVQVGPGSTLYGANAFQGVIHIVTKTPEDFKDRRSEFQLRHGTFATTRGDLATGSWDPSARRGFVVGAALGVTDGAGHLVRDEYAFGRNPAFPHGASYEPNSERSWSYLRGKLAYHDLGLSVGRRDVRLGYSGAWFAPFKLYDWKRAEQWADAVYKRQLTPKLSIETIGSYHDWTESFRNFSDIPADAAFTDPRTGRREALPGNRYDVDSHRWFLEQRVSIDSKGTFCPIGLECKDEARKRPTNQLFVGAGLRSESYHGNDFYASYQGESFQNLTKTNFALFVQDEYALAAGKAIFNAGVRFDTHPDYDNVVSPRAALIVPFRGDRGRLRLGYGSAYKEPANWQKYIDQPTGQGSPVLKPETIDMLEAAVSYRVAKDLHARVNLFRATQSDIITEFFDPTIADPRYVQYGIFGKFHPQQLGYDADLRGAEVEVRGRFTDWVRGYANYSYLDSKVKRLRSSLPGNAPPGTPLEVAGEYDSQHRFNAGVTLSSSRFAVSAGAHYVGKATDTSLEFTPIDPSSASSPLIGIRPVDAYTLVEANLRLDVFKDVAVSVGAWNLSAMVHEQMLGAPVPGPTFFVQVSYPR